MVSVPPYLVTIINGVKSWTESAAACHVVKQNPTMLTNCSKRQWHAAQDPSEFASIRPPQTYVPPKHVPYVILVCEREMNA
jgi:hypothetical protein